MPGPADHTHVKIELVSHRTSLAPSSSSEGSTYLLEPQDADRPWLPLPNADSRKRAAAVA